MLWGGLPFRKGWQARREDGGRGSAVGKGWIYTSYAGHAVLWAKTRPFHASPLAAKTVLQPRPRLPYSPAIPRGERRALPAPAQGSSPLGIPFLGTGPHLLRQACRLMGENAPFPRFAARGEDRLAAPPATAIFPRRPAGRTAGSARTRPRDQGRLSSKCNSLEEDIERRAPVETFAGPVVDQIKDALKLRL